jgi:hypothetical protein
MVTSRRPSGPRISVRRRWSPRRLVVIIPMTLVSLIVPLAILFYVTRRAQLLLVQKEALFCTPTRLSGVILLFCVLLMTLSLGGMFITLLSLLPRNRRTKDLKFLATIGAIPLPIYLLSIGSMVCVTQTEIHHRQQLLAAWHHYPLFQIETMLRSVRGAAEADGMSACM